MIQIYFSSYILPTVCVVCQPQLLYSLTKRELEEDKWELNGRGREKDRVKGKEAFTGRIEHMSYLYKVAASRFVWLCRFRYFEVRGMLD